MTESNKRDDSEAVGSRAVEDEPAEAAEAHDTGTDEQQADEQFDPVAAHPDVVELDYEQARDELADVVRRLEAGGLSLEDSLALWERGEALATTCERHLAGAQERVDRALSAVREEESPAAQ